LDFARWSVTVLALAGTPKGVTSTASPNVVPAKAGTQNALEKPRVPWRNQNWIPAFAGMTGRHNVARMFAYFRSHQNLCRFTS
jgi:hypothetical protein